MIGGPDTPGAFVYSIFHLLIISFFTSEYAHIRARFNRLESILLAICKNLDIDLSQIEDIPSDCPSPTPSVPSITSSIGRGFASVTFEESSSGKQAEASLTARGSGMFTLCVMATLPLLTMSHRRERHYWQRKGPRIDSLMPTGQKLFVYIVYNVGAIVISQNERQIYVTFTDSVFVNDENRNIRNIQNALTCLCERRKLKHPEYPVFSDLSNT